MGEIDEEKWQMILDEYDANQDGKVILLIKFKLSKRFQKMNLLNYYKKMLKEKREHRKADFLLF